jgi:hypothetical protein
VTIEWAPLQTSLVKVALVITMKQPGAMSINDVFVKQTSFCIFEFLMTFMVADIWCFFIRNECWVYWPNIKVKTIISGLRLNLLEVFVTYSARWNKYNAHVCNFFTSIWYYGYHYFFFIILLNYFIQSKYKDIQYVIKYICHKFTKDLWGHFNFIWSPDFIFVNLQF